MVKRKGVHQRGVTLIELLVGLVILVLMLGVALPYTSAWIDNNAVIESGAVLQQATTRTKAMAIANPQAIINGSAAAYVCANASNVFVQPVNATTCGSGFVWQGALKSSVSVKVGTADWRCTGFDTSGLPIALTLGSTACTTSTSLTISKGDTSDALNLY